MNVFEPTLPVFRSLVVIVLVTPTTETSTLSSFPKYVSRQPMVLPPLFFVISIRILLSCQIVCDFLFSLSARVLPFVRDSQRVIETRFAQATSHAAFALRESVSAGRAPEPNSGRRVTFTVGMERDSFRPAPDALFAKGLLALRTHTGHEHP